MISKRLYPHCWSLCWFELWLQFDLLWGKQAYKSRNSISFCHLVKSYQAFALIKLSAICITGPIFLGRFKLYMFSFTFGFMFANICFEKNQNSKIYVMFIINITWNETGICSFWAVWAVRAVGKNQVLTCASLVC